MNVFQFFFLVLKASLFSTSGMGNVPSLHSDLIARGWTTEHQFAESLAVGQVAPGPNGLWVISLGYLIGGLPGALAALGAICLPPLLVIVLDRFYHRVEHQPAVEGFVRGLSLAVVGVFVVVLLRLLQGAGLDVRSVMITLASVGLGLTKRVPVIAILVIAAVAGLTLYHRTA